MFSDYNLIWNTIVLKIAKIPSSVKVQPLNNSLKIYVPLLVSLSDMLFGYHASYLLSDIFLFGTAQHQLCSLGLMAVEKANNAHGNEVYIALFNLQ